MIVFQVIPLPAGAAPPAGAAAAAGAAPPEGMEANLVCPIKQSEY